MKIRNVHIDNYKIFHNFDIDFTQNDRAQNLIVLAGINGSGKTTLMKDVLSNFSKGVLIDGGISFRCEVFNKAQNKIIVESINPYSPTPGLITESQTLSIALSSDSYYFEVGQSNHLQAKDTILKYIDKLIYQQDKKSSEAYDEVQRILNDLFADFNLQIDFKGVNQNREILFKNSKNEQLSIDQLSSGEQELINKSFSLYLADMKDSIIFVDEPEGSMHPSWQSRIAGIYQKIADENNNQIFLATHSPHIVASVKKEQVRVLVKQNDEVKVIQDFSGSYGWPVDKVLLEIFRLSGLRTPEMEKEMGELKEMVFNNEYESEAFIKKMNKLQDLLGYDDIDLTMLRFEILKRKKAQ
jgi:predicted ATP-binding protein involved in virulence